MTQQLLRMVANLVTKFIYKKIIFQYTTNIKLGIWRGRPIIKATETHNIHELIYQDVLWNYTKYHKKT